MSAESKTLGLSKYLLALCLSTSVLVAWAQDTDSDTDSDTDVTIEEDGDVAALDRVTVTGSLIRREEFTSTSPMQVITAESQFQAGQMSVAEMLQGSTVAAGTTQLNNQFSGYVIQGGTGVQTLDLRGLGAARSLVLLNGRRPGGSGTRGEVNSVDLSNIPEIAVNRFELVLDGSSSIYGSDAVAGVANIITRRSVDRPEVQVLAQVPLDSGGEFYRVSGITGFNTDKGAFTVSAQWELQEPLQVGDRNFLNCQQDRVWNEQGQRIDREDRSITAGTPLGGCQNLYTNTVIDAFTGARYVPSPDGTTIGPIPGYRPRTNGTYNGTEGQAYYDDVLNSDFLHTESAINRKERVNVYATADYAFDFWGGVDFDADFMYSRRDTEARGFRQFFPLVSSSDYIPYPNDPDYNPGIPVSQVVMPYTSNTDVTVDFYYVTMGLQGDLPTKRYWSWQTYASYSYSDGDYMSNGILASQSGDIRYDDSPPRVDYFDPAFLSGANMQQLIDAVGVSETGNTVYDQFQWVGIITGDLMDLPAGTVGTAFGLEYRTFSIDDQPPPASQNGDLWGQSSAIATKGSNDVIEAFVEADIPLMSGRQGAEDITLNLSARGFDYKNGGSDIVWKAGLNWQINPVLRLRSTVGTSYRAPALFEQYLGNQTGFLDQMGIDPCIDWGESNNDNIRANCAAIGIPEDYNGFPGSSALIISGGGVDNLEAETSDAFTAGFVITPEFADISIAADYYDFTVNDQIAQLGAENIAGGCYSGSNFPNAFCDLLTRAPGNDPSAPYNILTVLDSYVNVNKQRVRGVDMTLVWNRDFNFGTMGVEAQSTWTIENTRQLFSLGSVEGFDETDYAGSIGSPENITNIRTFWSRNDWKVTWFMQYVSETDNSDFADEIITSYFGYPNARRDITMDAALYHNLSVFYQQDKWDFLLGVNNVLDETPDTVSTGSSTLLARGNYPNEASQYDLLGRRIFARFNFRF